MLETQQLVPIHVEDNHPSEPLTGRFVLSSSHFFRKCHDEIPNDILDIERNIAAALVCTGSIYNEIIFVVTELMFIETERVFIEMNAFESTVKYFNFSALKICSIQA